MRSCKKLSTTAGTPPKFREHLEKFKINMREGEDVRLLQKEAGRIKVETDQGAYLARTAIVASGRIPRKLGAEGEDEFKNRGVTYCATCDGPLFADMDVAVVGGGNAGLDATLQLMKMARKVYLIERSAQLRADPIMVGKARESGKVVLYNNTRVEKIYGDKLVKGISINREGGREELPVEGVFIEIGSFPASDFVKGVSRNEDGEIIVNGRCETNIPGLFAAGDVTSVPAKQIVVACGEGAKAALAAFEHLSATG